MLHTLLEKSTFEYTPYRVTVCGAAVSDGAFFLGFSPAYNLASTLLKALKNVVPQISDRRTSAVSRAVVSCKASRQVFSSVLPESGLTACAGIVVWNRCLHYK